MLPGDGAKFIHTQFHQLKRPGTVPFAVKNTVTGSPEAIAPYMASGLFRRNAVARYAPYEPLATIARLLVAPLVFL